ncbi:8459_t:CDS:1, partial [Racocetra persica]
DDQSQPQILDAQWLQNNQLQVTIESPTHDDFCYNLAPNAVGHFTYDDHNGHSYRFSKHAIFVNGYDYKYFHDPDCTTYTGSNPYNYIVSYDPKKKPPSGATVDIRLSIYWDCGGDGSVESLWCPSCDVKFNSK